MSGNYCLFAVNVIFVFIVPVAMFYKTAIVLIEMLYKFSSFH